MTAPRWLQVLTWRLISRNAIFRYWYRKHMTDVLFRFEANDIDPEYNIEWARKKLERLK